MGIKLTNNANATLAASINSSATSITLTSGQGARFPTLSAGDYFYATLVDTSNNLEIVKCTARSTDVLTVVRAQESTTARAYTTGDRIEIRLTAQTFLDATTFTPTAAGVSDQANTSTGYFDLPNGTTAQRPGSPDNGAMRYNSTIGLGEIYQSGFWQSMNFAYQIDFLVVGGGGGGGGRYMAGGGGGGGYLAVTDTAGSAAAYAIVVGAGGAGGSAESVPGSNGGNSSFNTTTAIGGGGGGSYSSIINGYSGGSGGGGSGYSGIGGSGTTGQGNAGGNGAVYGAGGGGGASAVGQNGIDTNQGGDGGAGGLWNGNYYAGGGGGGDYQGAGGSAGGSGVGGNGAALNGTPTAGVTNRGGGGGGANGYAGGAAILGGNGGSGVVIVRYLGSQRASGGTVTSSGGYTYHTFTSSGTFTA